MLVVLPFYDGDKHLAVQNLQWAKKLDGGKVEFTALLIYDDKTDPEPVRAVAAEYFSEVLEHRIDHRPGNNAWPRGANYMWRRAAQHLYAGFDWGTRAPRWLWWEPDASPVKKGWLKTLADADREGGKAFTGSVVDSAYMAGVGIYPRNVCHYSSDAFLVEHAPFDIVLGKKAVKVTHQINHLIQHLALPGAQSFGSKAEVENLLYDTAVLFHKCKDGSLIDCMDGRPPKPVEQYKGAPHELSFTQQTDWPAGFFHFAATPGACTVYFNPTLATVGGVDYLIARRWVQFRPGMWKSDIGVFTIGKNMCLTSAMFPAIPSGVENENWEDPRAFVHNGTIYLSCVTWGGPDWRLVKMHQVFAKLVKNRLEVVCHPLYGFNRASLATNQGNEKNWTWFVHDNAWHFVYQSHPHHLVVRYGQGAEKEWRGKLNTPDVWKWGDMRGGSCPVRVGKEYFCFTHSSLPSRTNRRTYFAAAYAFEAEPPFEITRMTTEPLLTASNNDPHVHGGPNCYFAGGSKIQDGVWTVVAGINDEACGWIKIPHADLTKRMEWV